MNSVETGGDDLLNDTVATEDGQGVDVYLFHLSGQPTLLESLAVHLDAQSISWKSGAKADNARIVVLLDAPSSDISIDALEGGAILLPAYSAGPWHMRGDSPVRLEQIVTGIGALLAKSDPSRLLTREMVQGAHDSVDQILDDEDDDKPHLLDRICGAIVLAIEHSFHLEAAGGVELGVALLVHASKAVHAHIAHEEPTDIERPLCEFLLDELSGTLDDVEAVVDDDASAALQILRETFNRFVLAKHTTDSLFTVDDLFEDLTTSGRALNASLICDILNLAIAEGTPIYNAGSHLGCAQIYLCAAIGLLRMLQETAPGEGETELRLRKELGPIVAESEALLEEDPDVLAWSLRRTFDELLATAMAERAWEHDC
jgi:hypothetical protein